MADKLRVLFRRIRGPSSLPRLEWCLAGYLMPALSAVQTRHLRLRAQSLHPLGADAPRDATELLRDLCGVQAQESLAALLAIQVRSHGLVASEVERVRVQDRSIVRTWCMRGTLHLLATEDLGWLLELLGPRLIRQSQRRYAQLGLDEDTCTSATRAIRDILGDQGSMTRDEMAQQLASRGIPTEGQATYHLLRRSGLEGVICFGPERQGKPTYVLVDDWAPASGAMTGQAALAELARRYLDAFGPARPEDLAAWSGSTLGEARAGFEMLTADLLELDLGGSPAWMPKSRAAWLDETPPDKSAVRLLPSYDPYLLGYRSRDLVVPPRFAKRVHPGGGVLRPTLLADGRALATWKLKRKRGRVKIAVEPFEGLGNEVMHALEDQVRRLGSFLQAPATLDVAAP